MDPEEILDSFSLPEELGSIEESYRPDSEAGPGFRPLIFYIQDAHANEDSANHISGIIRHLEEKYGLPLVLLEGGEGKLDSLFFKSFPDRELKEKILADYLRDGELSGGEAASIQSDFKTADYYGIEDQAIYRKNKKYFLESFKRKDENEAFLKKIRSELGVKASRYFSRDVRTYQEAYEAFHNESLDLLTYAKQIKAFYIKIESPMAFSASFSALQQLILSGENENPSGEKFEIALSGLIAEAQAKLLPSLPSEEQKKWGEFIQNVRTARNKLPEFIKEIEQNPIAVSITIPSILSSVSKSYQTLSSIEGTDIFTELHALEETLRKKLPRSAEEKTLLQDFYDLGLMERFNRLEINRKEWTEIQDLISKSRFKSLQAQKTLWESHLKFYQLVMQRDEILFRNMMHIAGQKKTKIVVLVTGGFHREGLTARFKKDHIPYAIMTPRIKRLGTQDNYFKVMRGKASYMKFYQGSLWHALAQDYALKLTNLLTPQDRFIYLKRWRDGIIQGAMREGRIEEAGVYTGYIDDLRQSLEENGENHPDKPLKSFLPNGAKQRNAEINYKLKVLSAGLKQMWKTGDITPESLGQLVRRVNAGPLSALSAEIALIHPSPLEFVPRSEVRAAPLPDDPKGQKKEASISLILSVQQKLDLAEAILTRENGQQHFKDFFHRMTHAFPLDHLETSSVERIADQIRHAYRLFFENITQDGHPIQIGIYNPLFIRPFQQATYAGHTELIVVAQDRVGLDRDITTAIAHAGANIEQSYTAKIRLHQSDQKVIIFIFEITRDKQPLTDRYFANIKDEIEKIPNTNEQDKKEVVLRSIPRSGEIVKGEIAILRELPGGIEDVVYDIFAGLRGSPHEGGNGSRITEIMRKDLEEFNEAIDRIVEQETFLPSVVTQGRNGMSGHLLTFIESLRSETLQRATEPLDQDNPHRQSALSIFLDIVKGRVEEAQKTESSIEGLSIALVEDIQDRVVTELRHKYGVFRHHPEQSQIEAIERQVKKFEDALTEAMDTKGTDPESLERLAGIKAFIESENGIKNAVIGKIMDESVIAPYAIAEVVVPIVKNLKGFEWKKQQLNATDIQKIFSNVIRLLNEQDIRGEFLTGVEAGNDLVLLARHADPFEILRLLEEFPEIKAIVSDEGSYGAHWALVAENRGILVSILEPFQQTDLDITDQSLVGTPVIVDGSGGLIMNPSQKTRQKYDELLEMQAISRYMAKRHAGEEARTKTGKRVRILANADSMEEIHDAMDNGAEGVGLVRTEYLFDEDNELLKQYLRNPTEANRNALVGYFREIFSDMALYTRNGTLTVRMFDLERDKKSFLDQAAYNPDKVYGLEYYWTDIGKKLLEIELEAAILANADSLRGQIRILFPMNQAPEDLAQKLKGRQNLIDLRSEEQQLLNDIAVLDVNYLNERLDQVIARVKDSSTGEETDNIFLNRIEGIRRGFMIETQEGINILPHILERADFISVGTNDLTISLFRDFRRVILPKYLLSLRESYPRLYDFIGAFVSLVLRPLMSLFARALLSVKEFEKLLYRAIPSVIGISRDATEDARYLQELQPQVMKAVRNILDQVADKNASLEGLRTDKRIPLCICGALAGADEFALYMAHALPPNVAVELSTSGGRIPGLKQFIRGIQASDTAFLDRKTKWRFDLHQEAARQAAAIMERQKHIQLAEYEELEQLKLIQQAQFPPDSDILRYAEVDGDRTINDNDPPSIVKVSVHDEIAEVVEAKILPLARTNAVSETRFYTIGNFAGLHMTPSYAMSEMLKGHKDVETELKRNTKDEAFNMKDMGSLIMAGAEKGTVVSVKLTGKESEVKEIFEKIEALESDNEKVFLPTEGAPEGTESRSEVRAGQKDQAEDDLILDEKRFLALIEEILDPAKIKGRNKHEWVTLHRRFFDYFIKDIEGSTEKSPAKNARMAVFRRFYGAEQAQNPLLKGVRKDSALEQAYRLKDELSSYYAAKVSTGHARENLFGLAKWTFLQITSQVARSLVGEEAEAVHSSPVQYEPLNSALLPTDYLEKFRDWLRYHNKKENFLYEPGSMVPGYFQMGESTPKNPKEAFAMNSVLALKFAGFEPSIRPFPEFARALVENGVQSVEFISPHRDFPEMSPPAFYIHFKKPLVSPAGEEYPGIAVAVFQNPLPDLAIENSPDLNEVKSSDGDQEWSKLLGLTFTEKVPIEEQILKLKKLLDLAFEGRLLPRTDYTYFSGKGAARLAAFMGRTAEESKVLERDFNLVLEKEASAKDLKKDKFYREPVTPQIEKETRRNFEKWAERAILFDEFGASDAAFEKGAAQRVDIIRNREGLKNLYAIPYYRPLTDLIFARQGDQWLMDQRDNGPYAKRLNELAPLLIGSYPLIEQLKSSFEESNDKDIFSVALLLQIAQALPVRLQRPFDKAKAVDVRKVVIELSRKHFARELDDSLLPSSDGLAKISFKSRTDFDGSIMDVYHFLLRSQIQSFAARVAEKLPKLSSLEAKRPLIETALEKLQLPDEEWRVMHDALKPLAEELAGFMLSAVQEDLSAKRFEAAHALIQKIERVLRHYPDYQSLAVDAKTSLHAAEEDEKKRLQEGQKDALPEYRRKAIEIREQYAEVFAADPKEYRVMAALVNQLADMGSLDSAEFQKRLIKVSNYLSSPRTKESWKEAHGEVFKLIKLIPNHEDHLKTDRSEVRSAAVPTDGELVSLLNEKKMDDIENIFDRPYGENEIAELFKTWDRITADGKIPRALLNPAEEIISRKSQRLVEKYPSNTKLRQSLDELTKDLREIGFQITGRIRKDLEDYTENVTSTLPIPEVILEEPVDARSPEWIRGKLAVFLNKKLRKKKWTSSPSSVLSRPSGIQQHAVIGTKAGRFTNFMTVDITGFAQEMMETYRILLDPYHNPQARNAISKGLVPVAIFEGTNKGFKASLISHESHYNELRGSILKGQLLIAFRFHGLPPGNFRLKFKTIKNAYSDGSEGRAQVKMEKWIRQREDGKILKDLSADRMKETLLRLAEEEKTVFRFEEIIPFQRDEEGRDWFLLPTGVWIARDLREIVKNIKTTYRKSRTKTEKRSRDIKIRIIREGDDHGYISWIDTKRSLKDMLGFLNSQADHKSKMAAREAHGLMLVFSIQRETRQYRYHIRRYPLEPFPPHQPSRSELRSLDSATTEKLISIQIAYRELLSVLESDFPRVLEDLPGSGQFYPTHGMFISDLIELLRKKSGKNNEAFPVLDFGSGDLRTAYGLALAGGNVRVTAIEMNPFLASISIVLQTGLSESAADFITAAYTRIAPEDSLDRVRRQVIKNLIPRINAVREELIKNGMIEKVELRLGDGLTLPFAPYKAIYLNFPHLRKEAADRLREKFIEKAVHELKPGAHIILFRHDNPVIEAFVAELEAKGFERTTEDFFSGNFPVLVFRKIQTADTRSEVRAKGKKGKTAHVEKIEIDKKLKVDKNELEKVMREIPQPSKRMSKKDRELYKQNEKYLFRNLHAVNLTLGERTTLRNFLVEKNLGLVGDWVGKLGFVTDEDAHQNGVLGLMRAISDYDYTIGQFSTYASWWIKNYIFQTPLTDHIARVPKDYQTIRNKYFKLQEAMSQQLGREPAIEEIANAVGVSEERLISAISWGKTVYSIDTSYEGNDESAAFHEILRKISRSPEEDAEMRETIHQSLSVLDRRSQVVMKLRYGIGTFPHSLVQIAEIFNLEKERIRQIQEAALTRIKDANRQSPNRTFRSFYQIKSSEDHADLYLVEQRGILPSHPNFEVLLRKGRSELENGARKKPSDIYHLASGEDLQEVRLPELGRYPQVQALGDDLIEHRLYTLIRGGDIVNNGKVMHVAFGLKEIRRNPILLMQQPEELFRLKALKVARSEARNKNQSSGDSFLKLTEQWSRRGIGELLLTANDGNVFKVHYFDEGEDDRFPGTRHRLTLSHGDKNIGYLHVRMTGLTATLYLSFSDDAYHYRERFYKDNPFSSAEDFDFYHDVFGMPSGQVEAIYVNEEYRSRYRGLGTSLLGLAMRLAQAKGVEHFEVDAVGPEPFFENLGFKAFRFRGTAQKIKDYELPLTPQRMKQEGVELPPIKVSRRGEQKDMRFGRSEIRNFDDAQETSWKVGTLNYFAHDKIKRLLDFARSAVNQKQSVMLVNDILDRTPVFSGFNNHSIRFFDWRPVWLHTLEERALREQDPVVRTKLLFLAQGFEMMGRNGFEDRDYLRISSLLTDTYKLAREIEMDNDLSSIERVRIDFEGEAEKIPGYLFIPSESPQGKNFPVVVIFHGLTSRKEHPYFDLLIKKLIGNKMAVLSVDLPRHGEYKKEFEGLDHFSRYARAIVQYLKQQTAFPSMDKEQIALFGFSFGGYIGLRLMLDREIEKEFQAVVVMNPPFQDSFLSESALRDHREYLEAIFNESEFKKLTSLVGRLALDENMFSFSPRQLEKLRIFLGEEDSVIATSDIEKVRRAFPAENITLYQREGHYFTDEVKNDAYQKAAEFFAEAFNRSELRKTDLRPVAEVILPGSVPPSFEKLRTASEILKRERQNGRSIAALIRELRPLMTEHVLDPVLPPGASGLQPETKESRVYFDALKTIEGNVTVEVHIPASIEQAPDDAQGILMDGFFRFVEGMVRLNPNFNFRLVFSSKEKKDRLRRFRRFNSANIRMISQKNRKFITDQSNEPAQLVIAENFPAGLASRLEGNGRFGFDAGTFADQSPVDWLGPDKITLEQTTLAALTTLASEKLKEIVPDPKHPNIYRAAGKSVLQGMEALIHQLAVEVTQSALSKRSA